MGLRYKIVGEIRRNDSVLAPGIRLLALSTSTAGSEIEAVVWNAKSSEQRFSTQLIDETEER